MPRGSCLPEKVKEISRTTSTSKTLEKGTERDTKRKLLDDTLKADILVPTQRRLDLSLDHLKKEQNLLKVRGTCGHCGTLKGSWLLTRNNKVRIDIKGASWIRRKKNKVWWKWKKAVDSREQLTTIDVR